MTAAQNSGPRVEYMNRLGFQVLALPTVSPLFQSRPEAETWLRGELAGAAAASFHPMARITGFVTLAAGTGGMLSPVFIL